MNIALVFNQRPTGLDRNDPKLEQYIEGDEEKTITAIVKAIASHGHKVTKFAIDSDIYERLRMAKDKIDLIFNLSEGINSSSDREAHIPMVAEILGIPYTGPNPLSSALILNKSRAKEIWRSNGVPTAKWHFFTSPDLLDLPSHLAFPLIVKPNGEGSGIGIKASSIVKNSKELKDSISDIVNNYHQNALVEEYLPGREFTIGLVGNGEDLVTLPIIEINFDAFPKGAPKVDTYEAKFVYGVTGLAAMHETEFCPAIVSKDLKDRLNSVAKLAYQTIGCREFGRVDLRLDNEGKVYVMEINHPPGLMSDPEESSFFTIAARVHGWRFEELIGQIIASAVYRLKL